MSVNNRPYRATYGLNALSKWPYFFDVPFIDANYQSDGVSNAKTIVAKVTGEQKEVDNTICLKHSRFTYHPCIKWQAFIESKVGFVLPEKQMHWLWHAVNQLARQYELDTGSLLKRAHTDAKLMQQVIDNVMISQSRFFRHPASLAFIEKVARYRTACQSRIKGHTYISANIDNRHIGHGFKQQGHVEDTDGVEDIDSVKDNVIDRQENTVNDINNNAANKIEKEEANIALRIWSVGCAYGQETWSIAMMLNKLPLTYKVWGSDISETVLKHARNGQYELATLNQVPEHYRNLTVQQSDYWQVAETLKRHTQFFKHNLFTTQMPPIEPVDIIMCQNVLIYFRQFDQRDILNRLVEQLLPGGYLILAPAEGSHWQHSSMQRIKDTTVNAWQKIN